MQSLSVLWIGDSITWAGNEDYQNPSYAEISVFRGPGTNLAEPCRDTRYFVEQFSPAVETVLDGGPWDVAHILLGSNDPAFNNTPNEFESNLSTLSMLLHHGGVERVMISIPPHPLGVLGEERSEMIDRYAERILSMCRISSWIHLGIDWRCDIRGMHTLPLYRDGDELHPSPKAHRIAQPLLDRKLMDLWREMRGMK